ncbi:LIM zinc-binding domain-containing protein [Balamuthia mandrillaris]
MMSGVSDLTKKFSAGEPAADNGTASPVGAAKTGKGSIISVKTERCIVCDKAVYFSDKLQADGKVFHKACFRCTECKNVLKLGSYASLEGKYYCKPHFKQLFALKGNYAEGFGEKKPDQLWREAKEGSQINAETSSTTVPKSPDTQRKEEKKEKEETNGTAQQEDEQKRKQEEQRKREEERIAREKKEAEDQQKLLEQRKRQEEKLLAEKRAREEKESRDKEVKQRQDEERIKHQQEEQQRKEEEERQKKELQRQRLLEAKKRLTEKEQLERQQQQQQQQEEEERRRKAELQRSAAVVEPASAVPSAGYDSTSEKAPLLRATSSRRPVHTADPQDGCCSSCTLF